MRRILSGWFIASAAAACAAANSHNAPLAYGCDEVVLVGRATLLSSRPAPSDLPLGQTQYAFRVDVDRVLFGEEHRPFVTVSALSHAQIRDDKAFLFFIRPLDDGDYAIRLATLWTASPQPALAETCSLPAFIDDTTPSPR